MYHNSNLNFSVPAGNVRNGCRYLVTAAAVGLCLLLPGALAGQVAANAPGVDAPSAGTISGHVRGPGDVAVPGATVELVELGTGEHKVTWTDGAGNYTLSGVKPGTYKLDVSLVGFQTDVRQPVPVSVGKPLRVNVALLMSMPAEAAAAGQRRATIANLNSLPRKCRSAFAPRWRGAAEEPGEDCRTAS